MANDKNQHMILFAAALLAYRNRKRSAANLNR